MINFTEKKKTSVQERGAGGIRRERSSNTYFRQKLRKGPSSVESTAKRKNQQPGNGNQKDIGTK